MSEYNQVPIIEVTGPKCTNLGGAGTGLDTLGKHMAAVDVTVNNAPGVDASIGLTGPKQDQSFAGLVMGNRKSSTPTMG